MYLFLAAGLIFLILLFSFNNILLLSRVLDSMLISFSLTKLWIFILQSLVIGGIFYIVYCHSVIFCPYDSFLYKSERDSPAYGPKNELNYWSNSVDNSYEGFSWTTGLILLALGFGLLFKVTRVPSWAISFTTKSVSMYLVTAGIGSPLLMQIFIPTFYYSWAENVGVWAYIVVFYKLL